MTADEFAVDPHVKVLDTSVVARAKRAGLDAIVYAPHFTRLPEIRARARTYTDDELLVLPGREVFTGTWRERKHVLALGLTDPVPDFITLDGAMAEFDRQDAVVLAPHPEFATVSLSAEDLRTYEDVIDAAEVYNPKHLPRQNGRARALVDEVGLPPVASSYAHLGRSVGVARTVIELDEPTEAGVLRAFADRRLRRVRHERGPRRWLTSATEMAHLCWENSWQKFDRLVLSGMEATHPRHVAYDDAFDDVAVY